MKDKRLFFKCFARSLGISLLLWGAAMAALIWVNYQWCREDVAVQSNELSMRIRSGEIILTAQPDNLGIVRFLPWEDGYCSAILTMSGGWLLRDYGGQLFLRAYTEDGDRLGQTQMLMGYTAMVEDADPEEEPVLYLVLDPVLSQEQMLAALDTLEGYREPVLYQGDAGAAGTEFTGLRAVGWREGQVLYVQKLTLCFETGEVVLADTQADLFPGQTPQSYSGTWVEFYSPLLGRGDPEPQLERYQALAAEVDELEERVPQTAQGGLAFGGGQYSNAYLAVGAVRPLASNYYLPELYALTGLKPVLLLTLGAAAALALFTAWLEYRAIRRERAFVRGAAHELKTPLAVVRTHAEALREDIAPAKRAQYLDTVVAESDRMAALVGGLLDLSRLVSGRRLEKEPLDFAVLTAGRVQRLDLLAEQKEVRLRTELGPAMVMGERLVLEEMVDELADNALKHCPPDGVVTLTLTQKGRQVKLTVDNDGEPIPPEHLGHLFEPFYRGDPGRSRAQGGAGLGLALVRAAAEAHGGSCRAANRAGGVTVTVELPGLQSET